MYCCFRVEKHRPVPLAEGISSENVAPTTAVAKHLPHSRGVRPDDVDVLGPTTSTFNRKSSPPVERVLVLPAPAKLRPSRFTELPAAAPM
ncbi:MAG: hypothetical protein ABI969_05610 [bacterium]